eukprot:TRINITY_DN11518_c0_g1_i1.p1 TRINITY_DN11518_c0_g1~~TRINITY_DN11518_c0_g1_i1.p1  ORF type:complete len:113 (+),score=8.95 TRINITY_DN11518_c0_g1_i1:3-341(+)
MNDLYHQTKQRGANSRSVKKSHNDHKNINSRSRNWYGKTDKHRQARRKADRHSHHRRRNHVRSQISKGDISQATMPMPSSGKRLGSLGKGRGHSWAISNRSNLKSIDLRVVE